MTEHASVLAPVEPGTDRWSQLVHRAQAADASRNWLLGDAALEIAPMGGTSANNGSAARLALFSEEVGVSLDVIVACRKASAAWSPGTRVPSTCWKVHHMLMGHQELIEPGMTVTQAHRALGHSTAGRPTIGRGPEPLIDDPISDPPDHPTGVDHPVDPHPLEALVQAKRFADRIDTLMVDFRALAIQLADDPEKLAKARGIVLNKADQLVEYLTDQENF